MSADSFKDTMFYPILFMLVTCLLFVGVLSAMYRSSEEKIKTDKKDSYQKIILNLLAEPISEKSGSDSASLLADYPNSFSKYIARTTFEGLGTPIYIAKVNNEVVGYCADITGKGLWGTMRALTALSPDFTTLQGLAIYEQMETPGLGARIGEDWFLQQFKSIPIIKTDASEGDRIINLELIPEGQKATSPLQIQQVTGATITSSSVTRMIKNELNNVYEAYMKQVKQ